MEQLTTAALTQLPQVRALGRHTGRDPLTLFWTASGIELEFTGSELWVDLFADYEVVEPWVSVELNGAWVARFAVNPGKSRVCLFRGMTPGKAKHVRLLKDVQAMHDDRRTCCRSPGWNMQTANFCPCRSRFIGWNLWGTASPAERVPSEPNRRRTGWEPFSRQKTTTVA